MNWVSQCVTSTSHDTESEGFDRTQIIKNLCGFAIVGDGHKFALTVWLYTFFNECHTIIFLFLLKRWLWWIFQLWCRIWRRLWWIWCRLRRSWGWVFRANFNNKLWQKSWVSYKIYDSNIFFELLIDFVSVASRQDEQRKKMHTVNIIHIKCTRLMWAARPSIWTLFYLMI